MQLFNTLATTVTVFGPHFDVALNWIGELIKGIITGVSSVGIGIILFSLILKGVVLPVDIIQRITMRKQNIKMKENQERMEKLQKQYANNKDLYNQKVMEMYKESGMSMFSSCLPMILSMVIFIVAINAFNAFSQYANIENYNTLVDAYNGKIEAYCPELKVENISKQTTANGEVWEINDDNSIIYYTVPVDANAAQDPEGQALLDYIKSVPNFGDNKKIYYINETNALAVQEIADFVTEKTTGENAVAQDEALQTYFTEKAQLAVKEVYEKEVYTKTSFVWIKNVWVTDASYKNPVLDYDSFKAEVSRENFEINGQEYDFQTVDNYTNVYKKDAYDIITGKLDTHKTEANGYFVLILLSIGTILLQQFVSMRSQKEQQKYSTVDGQGAMQQKTMMVTMTAMFAIFSFMYSSAFSIYLIISNLFSMLSTLIINKAVDIADKKKKNTGDAKYSERYAAMMKNKKDK